MSVPTWVRKDVPVVWVARRQPTRRGHLVGVMVDYDIVIIRWEHNARGTELPISVLDRLVFCDDDEVPI